MKSLRSVLRELTEVAGNLESEIIDSEIITSSDSDLKDILKETLNHLRAAIHNSYDALNRSDNVTVLVRNGEVQGILSDNETDLGACLVVYYDTPPKDADLYYHVEVELETNHRQEVYMKREPIEVNPEMVDVLVKAESLERS